jgi:hypothetical protein
MYLAIGWRPGALSHFTSAASLFLQPSRTVIFSSIALPCSQLPVGCVFTQRPRPTQRVTAAADGTSTDLRFERRHWYA